MKFLSFITLAALLSPLYLPAMEMPNKKSQPKTQEPNQRVMNAQLMMMLIAQGKPHEALLVKAINSTNPKEAYEGFKELSEIDSDEKWHAMALMSKGQSLAKGEGVKQDRDAALKCYQDCYNKHKDPQALLCIGNHYEEDSKTSDDFKKAADCFKKAFAGGAGDPMAGYRYARLIYNENIKPESDEVTDIIKFTLPAANKSITEALYLFASTLLDNNHESFVEAGLPAFFKAAKQGDAFSAIQLGILFKNGLYVPKDSHLAQDLFNKALTAQDSAINKLAKAYMYRNGIGIGKDLDKAKKLLQESRPELGVNQSFIDNLFAKDDTLDFMIDEKSPTEITIPKESMNAAPQAPAAESPKAVAIEPIEPIQAPQELKQKISEPAQPLLVKASTNVPPQTAISLLPKEIKYRTLLDQCNALSQNEDGSSLELDFGSKKILVHDPKYKHEFVVPFEESDFRQNVNLVQLRYDERIQEWFTKSLKELKSDDNKRWKVETHRFGKAVDYLMQIIGIKNPTFNGKANTNHLMHEAESLKLKNKGHFEYTFRKEGTKSYLFHRHYRPYKTDPKEKTK